jgi:hypothetical protein
MKACAHYDETLDRLIILLEDVLYVTYPVIPESVDVFIHPGEGKVVGCQIYNFSRYPHGKEILKMLV